MHKDKFERPMTLALSQHEIYAGRQSLATLSYSTCSHVGKDFLHKLLNHPGWPSEIHIMADLTPFDFKSSLVLLAPHTPSAVFPPEEDIRPWRVLPYQTFNKPFLRLWDCYSGSQPVNRVLTSRDPTIRLDNYDDRKESLETHIDHSKWRPTPYISFTTSSLAIQEIANMRLPKRGKQTLTVIDPGIRMKKGLPILEVEAEMERYCISDPYRANGRYYSDHYVCLWEVAKDEVVGQWQWNDLASNPRWYEEIIMPAISRNRSRSMEKCFPQTPFDLSALTRALPGNNCQIELTSNASHVSKVVNNPHNQLNISPGCGNASQVRQENTKWSVISQTTTYLEKLKLLCHSSQELERYGYITKQLSESQLHSKLWCSNCGVVFHILILNAFPKIVKTGQRKQKSTNLDGCQYCLHQRQLTMPVQPLETISIKFGRPQEPSADIILKRLPERYIPISKETIFTHANVNSYLHAVANTFRLMGALASLPTPSKRWLLNFDVLGSSIQLLQHTIHRYMIFPIQEPPVKWIGVLRSPPNTHLPSKPLPSTVKLAQRNQAIPSWYDLRQSTSSHWNRSSTP